MTQTEISYSYVDESSTHRSGTWTGNEQRAVDRAIEALDEARVLSDGDIGYHADEGDGTKWYRLTREEAAQLGAALLAGHRMGSVYSIWCAETGASMSEEECEAAGIDCDVHCACGRVTGERCNWTGPRSETVVVEWMPEHLRASHEAAGNRGSYPANGAERLRVERSCGERMEEAEGEWAEIVEGGRYLVRGPDGRLWTGDEWVQPYEAPGSQDAATWDNHRAARQAAERVGGEVIAA